MCIQGAPMDSFRTQNQDDNIGHYATQRNMNVIKSIEMSFGV